MGAANMAAAMELVKATPRPDRARALTARRLRVMHYFRDLLDQHRRLNGAILTVTPVDRSRP